MKLKCFLIMFWFLAGLTAARTIDPQTSLFPVVCLSLMAAALMCALARSRSDLLIEGLGLAAGLLGWMFLEAGQGMWMEGSARELFLCCGLGLVPFLEWVAVPTHRRSALRAFLSLVWVLLCLLQSRNIAPWCLMLSVLAAFFLQSRVNQRAWLSPAFWKSRLQSRFTPSAEPSFHFHLPSRFHSSAPHPFETVCQKLKDPLPIKEMNTPRQPMLD